MAANRHMVQIAVYATPDQVDELRAHAKRFRVSIAALIRSGIDSANAELKSAPSGELPARLRERISKHGRQPPRRQRRRRRAPSQTECTTACATRAENNRP
jgi:hypothetical protein